MNTPVPQSSPYAPAPKPLKKPDGIRHIIAVISGKGGVGKSTVCANLATALLRRGSKVGVMDADLTGHSQSILFNTKTPLAELRHNAIPADCFGVKVASFGFLYPDAKSVIWRGPMISNGIKSLFMQTQWGELDYLLIDLPPGTSDAQLTIIRDIPLDGGIVVTTPDSLASAVAERGLTMLLELKKPVLGIVENMCDTVCPHCGKAIDVFGEGVAGDIARRHSTEVLGRVPIDTTMRNATASRTPITTLSPNSQSSKAFTGIGEAVARILP